MTSTLQPTQPSPPTAPAAGGAKPKRPLWQRILLIVVIVVVALILVGTLAAAIYTAGAAQPMPEALAALASDASVTVTDDDWFTFTPTGASPATGFIFYPGGHVDARAYAPPARALAEQGNLVVITPMPLTLAIINPNRADAVIAAHPEIQRWYIGGHSLGGATAAIYADRNPGKVQGVIFWAAYPPDGNSLADQPELAVTSIYGTLDGLATVADIEASRALVPPSAAFVPVDGGNHAQFGYYGDQSGDNPATITRAEQQAQVIAATGQMLAAD
jgi:hypothetical protein